MNKHTRDELEKIHRNLEVIQMDLTSFSEVEQEKYENSPDSLKETDRVLAYETAAELLFDAANSVGDAMDSIVAAMD